MNILNYILKDNKLSIEESIDKLRELEINEIEKLKKRIKPNFHLYLDNNFGNIIEKFIISYFEDLKKSKIKKFDGKCEDLRIEIKSCLALNKNKGNILERSLSLDDFHLNESMWSSIKPDNFDFLLGVIVFNDTLSLFLIPSEDIGKYEDIKLYHPIKLNSSGSFKSKLAKKYNFLNIETNELHTFTHRNLLKEYIDKKVYK